MIKIYKNGDRIIIDGLNETSITTPFKAAITENGVGFINNETDLIIEVKGLTIICPDKYKIGEFKSENNNSKWWGGDIPDDGITDITDITKDKL